MNKDKNLNNYESNDCRSNYRKLCNGIPLFIKSTILITLLLYILNILFSSISQYLSNVPYITIYNYQIWRVFTTSLITTKIVNIIFAILFWVKYASNLEAAIGTIKYCLIFIMNSILIQIIYTLLFFIISLFIKDEKLLSYKINNKGQVNNCGIWPYIICEITLLSLSNPNYPIKFLFFPEFSTKFYPIIAFIFFGIFNTLWTDLEVLCGVVYAFLYHFIIKKKLKISNNLVRRIENISCINCFKNFGGFISVNANKYSSPGMTDNPSQRVVRDVVVNQNTKGFVPFTNESNATGDSARVTNGENPKNDNSERTSKAETLDVKIQ